MANVLTANQADCGDTLGTTEGWWASGDEGSLSSSTAAYRSSPRSVLLTANAAATIYVRASQYGASGWLCPAGSVVNASQWARRASGTTGGDVHYVVIDWLQSDGTYISTSTGSTQGLSSSFSQSTLVDAVAPTNTGRCTMLMAVWGSVAINNAFHFDDVAVDIDPPGREPSAIALSATIPALMTVRNALVVPGGTGKQGKWD